MHKPAFNELFDQAHLLSISGIHNTLAVLELESFMKESLASGFAPRTPKDLPVVSRTVLKFLRQALENPDFRADLSPYARAGMALCLAAADIYEPLCREMAPVIVCGFEGKKAFFTNGELINLMLVFNDVIHPSTQGQEENRKKRATMGLCVLLAIRTEENKTQVDQAIGNITQGMKDGYPFYIGGTLEERLKLIGMDLKSEVFRAWMSQQMVGSLYAYLDEHHSNTWMYGDNSLNTVHDMLFHVSLSNLEPHSLNRPGSVFPLIAKSLETDMLIEDSREVMFKGSSGFGYLQGESHHNKIQADLLCGRLRMIGEYLTENLAYPGVAEVRNTFFMAMAEVFGNAAKYEPVLTAKGIEVLKAFLDENLIVAQQQNSSPPAQELIARLAYENKIKINEIEVPSRVKRAVLSEGLGL